MIANEWTDPDLLHFNQTITAISPTELSLKFRWEHPFAISQTDADPPERLEIVLNVEKYVDGDGLSLPRNFTISSFVPRQIPTDSEVTKLD